MPLYMNARCKQILNLLLVRSEYISMNQLAQARPEDGVNCLDLSLTVFREPVVFSEYRWAKLVLVLAAEDQEKHLKILQDLLTLLSQPGAVLHFFCGATAGAGGNATGGLKGCVLGSFVHGVVATFLAAGLYPVLGQMGFANTLAIIVAVLFLMPVLYNYTIGRQRA